MKKVRCVNLHEIFQVDEELSIKAYYAGHVLGAAMFEVRVGQQSIVYTVRFCKRYLCLLFIACIKSLFNSDLKGITNKYKEFTLWC